MPVYRLPIARSGRACSKPSSGISRAGGKVVPFTRPQVSGPAYDVAFWRELAFKSEANGDLVVATSYWQAAIGAALLLAPSSKGDAELRWLRGRLTRASAVMQHVAGGAAVLTVH